MEDDIKEVGPEELTKMHSTLRKSDIFYNNGASSYLKNINIPFSNAPRIEFVKRLCPAFL